MLYLVRHADAVPESHDLPDEYRHLTAAGRAAAAAAGDSLSARGVRPAAVFTSPLPRATQTAELLVTALGFTGVVITLSALAPGGDEEDALRRVREAGVAIVVGHEPGLSAIAGLAVGEPVSMLGKAEIVAIDAGVIDWRGR